MQPKDKSARTVENHPASAMQARITTILVLTSDVHRFPGLAPGESGGPGHRILRGISEAALRRRVSVPIQFVDRELAEKLSIPANRPPALQQGLVSGLIIVSAYTEQIMESLRPRIPFVVIPSPEQSLKVDSIGPEHLHGVEMLVRYLYQLGHTRIGFASLQEYSPWSHERFAGYLYALNKLGLPFMPEDVINMFGSQFPDRKLIAQVIAQTRAGVSAWVCVSDALAAQVYHALNREGINVPEQVSVTGFDGAAQYRDCPPFTTIAVPWAAMGAGALTAVLERIEEPDKTPSHRAFHGRFVEGETTGSSPSSPAGT